jgi:membrane protein YdbS with pleckstrin-like domain
MRAVLKLILGETRILPAAIALVLGAGLVLYAVARDTDWWRHAGGFLLLAGVVAALSASLRVTRGR